MSAWLTVIGMGEDGYWGLGQSAQRALLAAPLIIGAPRQLALLPTQVQAERQPWPQPFSLEPVLNRRGQALVVLASGDPMLFGVGASLARQLSPNEMQVFPAPSSCSLAAARMGWALQDVTLLSLVARPLAALNRHLYAGARLLIFSQDGRSPAAIAALLCTQGFAASRLVVLEHLGSSAERRLEGLAGTWSLLETAALNIVALECCADPQTSVCPVTSGLPDTAYQHDGQLTKRDVRAIALARLAPLPGQLLWDVGAGCGSIAIEWLRAHPTCRAIAIEADSQRQALIRQNSERLGVPQLQLIAGRAPQALEGLAPPDAIFIGGGVTVPGVMAHCWAALRPGGRLVVNAVTLQSEALLIQWQAQQGGALTRIALAHNRPLGRFDTWQSALPIILWDVQKPVGNE